MSARTTLALCLCLGAWLCPATVARAADPPLGLQSCEQREGLKQCSGRVASWDGVPLDTTLTLPGGEGNRLPLVIEIHGLGNSKHEYLDPASTAYTDNAYGWARAGYAVLTYTARGFWGSCGTPESRLASPSACARGYIRLADARYEVRDSQELAGRLVDEGVVDPARIGATGDSYGGGQTFMLAALNDRVMLPDGRLVPWRSPDGIPLRIAAAAPVIPWTDLVYAVAPNGSNLTYAIAPPAAGSSPVGVAKASVTNAIFAATQTAIGPGQPVGEPFVPGRPMGFLSPPGVDPEADVTTWVARTNAGEPYTDDLARSIVRMLTRHHSAYHIDSSRPPSPLFVASGFTDDIFPVDEVTRFANRARRDHPGTPMSFLFGDFGHQRASNKAPDRDRLIRSLHAFLDHHLRGEGPPPGSQVTALTQTCPRSAPSGGPYTASTFTELARGEVRLASATSRTVRPTGGDPRIGLAIDPATGGGDACVSTSAADQGDTATYRLPAARGSGYTVLGAPTVIARLTFNGQPGVTQLAARLWDVASDGRSQTLVARGSYRPSGRGKEVFQLHPTGYRFEAGHVAKLELLGNDAPYGRPSNVQTQIEVTSLELRLPVHEPPDCRTVLPAAAPVLPPGQELAPGVDAGAASGCDDRRTMTVPAGEQRPRSGAANRTRAAVTARSAGEAALVGSKSRGLLPFTGLTLALMVGAAAILLGAGIALRKLAARTS